MKQNRRKGISLSMVLYQFRDMIGNPYIHIFGVGLPLLMGVLISNVAAQEVTSDLVGMICTTIYLGIGVLIPMASILMGYAVSYAQELDKGIPQRMQLFGLSEGYLLINRIVAELIYIAGVFILYFVVGNIFLELNSPTASGVILYIVCILVLSMLFFALAHGIASICRKFGKTYCVSMILYFIIMILGGMMGVQYEALPKVLQTVAKLLPVTYINRDFYTIWIGETYNFSPMIQSYLFFGAFAGIVLFIGLKKKPVTV